MGKLSILNLADPPAVDPPRDWGTPEEQYRRLCMLCLLCRYAYCCHSVSLITDAQYDALERMILDIENKDRLVLHPKSPTLTVGSECEEDYPQSVQMIWRIHKEDGTLDALPGVIGSFMEGTGKTWGL